MKTKSNKQQQQKQETSNNVSQVETTNYYRNVLQEQDMFNNVVQQHVITVDMSRASMIDYMSMSRVAFFRLAVKRFMTVNELKIIDFKFYRDTNDRARSQKEAKEKDLLTYSHKRTMKQLNDVVKEVFAQELFRKNNLSISTAKEYENAMLKMLKK